MFDYIKGTYISSGDGYVVIENGGIGYTVFTSLNTLGAVSGGGDVIVYTYLYLREGIMDLYGFSSEEERSMFLKLISISGIGPKAAVSVLSLARPEKIALAILTGDYKFIQKAQGVGPKAAQRIVMELKDKIEKMNIEVSADDEGEITSSAKYEALSALLVLGYSENEAKKALSVVDSADTETMIKQALKRMM